MLTQFQYPMTLCSKDPAYAFYREAAWAVPLCAPDWYTAGLFSQSCSDKRGFTVATPCVWEDCPARLSWSQSQYGLWPHKRQLSNSYPRGIILWDIHVHKEMTSMEVTLTDSDMMLLLDSTNYWFGTFDFSCHFHNLGSSQCQLGRFSCKFDHDFDTALTDSKPVNCTPPAPHTHCIGLFESILPFILLYTSKMCWFFPLCKIVFGLSSNYFNLVY